MQKLFDFFIIHKAAHGFLVILNGFNDAISRSKRFQVFCVFQDGPSIIQLFCIEDTAKNGRGG